MGPDFQEDDQFPQLLKTLQGKDYTFKLKVTADNIQKKNQAFVATNIMMGWDYKEETVTEPDIIENSQSKMPEPSGSSYHLDEISQLNYTNK
ncbi:hypothetical protein DCAR_0100409 [Daucus carota subsp. sativus]|uniref:Uncharacterized protein n=1 Tax=Daucus carota subsp. sativus TaxID=79200 RepID=A0A164TS11_DAUCS|nr:hypothetical protein DCAR_0100409 [Daucus carota subsp. sativus]